MFLKEKYSNPSSPEDLSRLSLKSANLISFLVKGLLRFMLSASMTTLGIFLNTFSCVVKLEES